jgi:hypothetical protein
LIILPSTNMSKCRDCQSKDIRVFFNLFEGLLLGSTVSSQHFSSNIKIYLELQPDSFFILLNDLAGEWDLFRRASNTSITIEPLPCGVIDAEIGCLIVNSTLRTRILLKSLSIRIFVSGKLTVKNIIFDGSDLFYRNRTQYCFKNDLCCSSFTSADDLEKCVDHESSYRDTNMNQWRYGFFTLEAIIDDPLPDLSFLLIEDCIFRNINLNKFDQGISAIVKPFAESFFRLKILSSRFENVYLPEGIFSNHNKELSLESAKIYKGFDQRRWMMMIDNLVEINDIYNKQEIVLNAILLSEYSVFKISFSYYPMITPIAFYRNSSVFKASFEMRNIFIKNLYSWWPTIFHLFKRHRFLSLN